jgi:hypothetical protein
MAGQAVAAAELALLGNQLLQLAAMLPPEMVVLDWLQVLLALRFFTVAAAVVD